jgi:hypothetical protein
MSRDLSMLTEQVQWVESVVELSYWGVTLFANRHPFLCPTCVESCKELGHPEPCYGCGCSHRIAWIGEVKGLVRRAW